LILTEGALYAQPEPAEETFIESGKPEAAYNSREDQRPSRYHDQDQLPDVHLRFSGIKKLRLPAFAHAASPHGVRPKLCFIKAVTRMRHS
jgi:hypothetical protein